MEVTECPMCGNDIHVEGRKEREILECADCGVKLEIVSQAPIVLEILQDAGEEWDWESETVEETTKHSKDTKI